MSDTKKSQQLKTAPSPDESATPEQMEEMRQRMVDYYNKQNPLLELQSTHEKHLADIEESRCRRLTMSIRLANMMAEAQQAERVTTQAKEPKKDVQTKNIEKLARKLKTETHA